MRTSLRRDLKAALKARDRVSITALRSALAAIENAEALPADHLRRTTENEHVAGAAAGVGATEAERRQLTDTELHAIVEKEAHDRAAAAGEYERLGRHDRAESLRSEADVLNRYLS